MSGGIPKIYHALTFDTSYCNQLVSQKRYRGVGANCWLMLMECYSMDIAFHLIHMSFYYGFYSFPRLAQLPGPVTLEPRVEWLELVERLQKQAFAKFVAVARIKSVPVNAIKSTIGLVHSYTTIVLIISWSVLFVNNFLFQRLFILSKNEVWVIIPQFWKNRSYQ